MNRQKKRKGELSEGIPQLLRYDTPFLDIKTINTVETMSDSDHNTDSPGANFVQLAEDHSRILEHIDQRHYNKAHTQLMDLIEKLEIPGSSPKEASQLSNTRLHQLHVCFYNLAVVHNKLKHPDIAETHLEQSCIYLEYLISNMKTKEQYLIHTIQYIKIQLQHCVLMSQNQKHSCAAAVGSRVISRLIECFQIMKSINQDLITSTRKRKRKTEGLIDFRFVILKEAKQKLQFLSSINPPEKLVNESLDELNSIANKLYTWKSNLENNEKYIRKELQLCGGEQKQSRNILGIAKTPKWIETFHMGSIMGLNPKKLDFHPSADPYLILSENKILELVIYTSAAFFTVSTEVRLRETDESTQYMNESMKFLRMHSNQYIVQCKIMHLKAIELAGRFLPTSNQYISHLISSFNKNYKYFMEQISEEASSLIPSVVEIHRKNSHAKFLEKQNLNKTKSKKKRNISSSKLDTSGSKNPKRKRSCAVGPRHYGHLP